MGGYQAGDTVYCLVQGWDVPYGQQGTVTGFGSEEGPVACRFAQGSWNFLLDSISKTKPVRKPEPTSLSGHADSGTSTKRPMSAAAVSAHAVLCTLFLPRAPRPQMLQDPKSAGGSSGRMRFCGGAAELESKN